MESSNSKGVVYVRRGDGEREANGMEDAAARDVVAERDDNAARLNNNNNNGHRFEGKVMRKKRGFRDVASSDKKYLSKFKRISERGDDSPPPDRDRDDTERRPGGPHSSGKEKSWKEIDYRKPARSRILNGKSDTEGDGSNGKGPDDRKERIDRVGGKIQSGNHHFKVLNAKFPQKRKPLSGSSDFDVQGESKRKKSSEPIKKRRHRLILQDHSDDDDYYVPIKKDPNPPEPRAAAATDGEKEADADAAGAGAAVVGSSGPPPDQGVRKSSRVPKKKVLEDFEDDVPDVGMIPKSGKQKHGGDANGRSESQESDFNEENEAGASDRGTSESDPDAEDWNEDLDASKSSKQAKTAKASDPFSYGGAKGRSAPLTARQRTIQLEKDGNDNVGANLIEFPDGLSHFSRRGTTKLTLEDRQAKKAEAASRRKQVVEKAAKEMQATAIQKILGQDSSRRKKEERLQKQREEIEQGKKAAALEAPVNSVRWTLGPQGTTVSWSQDAELPEIFFPSAYPPPPQLLLCAAPSCSKPRKYRDSKSNLPLCSLQCYRVVNPTTTSQLVST